MTDFNAIRLARAVESHVKTRFGSDFARHFSDAIVEAIYDSAILAVIESWADETPMDKSKFQRTVDGIRAHIKS
jgi:hypothetical protein